MRGDNLDVYKTTYSKQKEAVLKPCYKRQNNLRNRTQDEEKVYDTKLQDMYHANFISTGKAGHSSERLQSQYIREYETEEQ